MSTQPPQKPNNIATTFLWIGIVLWVGAMFLGIYALVNHFDTLFTVISFVIVGLAVPLGVIQIAPKTVKHLQQSWRIGISIAFVCILLISIALNLIAYLPHQTSTVLSETPTIVRDDHLFQVIYRPIYANVEITLVSSSLSNQDIKLDLSLVNNGKGPCTDIKFHVLNLIDSSGKKLKPTSTIDQSWTLPPGRSVLQSVHFRALGKEAQYTLAITLDVGGCATPHDQSSSRYAQYQVVVTV